MENEELKEPMQENAASENESGQQEVVSEETVENSKEETAAQNDESTETAAPEKEKKGFFGKKKKDAKDLQIEELTDRVKRNLAEFDNYRKRTEKEKAAMFEIGAKSVVEKMLPIVDNFERGLAMIPEEEKGSSFAEGMDKIYRQLLKNLEEVGVRPIEAVGQPFDPNFHNAVMHIEDENLGENVVAEEFQKGYLYRESVVRHSMVKVAN